MHRSLAALAAASLFALAACGGSDEPSPDPTSAATTEATTDAPNVSQQEITVNESIKDDVMGHTIKITGLVRDFTAPANTNIPEGGGEWVLVKVDVTAGKKYSGGVQGGFKLTSGGGQLAGAATSIIDGAMTDAGFTPWKPASAGEHTEGWIAFQVNTRSDAYQLEYKRLAASVIGGDPIDEKIWAIDLPTA